MKNNHNNTSSQELDESAVKEFFLEKRILQVATDIFVVSVNDILRAGLLFFTHESLPRQLPPRFAEFLVYLIVPKSSREAILGDLEEDFNEVREKFGLRHAKFYYWWQVGRSAWPFISDFVKKFVTDYFRSFTSR
jgi:hypothetical protein